MRYLRRDYTATAEAVDVAVAVLWETGTLGVEEKEERAGGAEASRELVAWFSEDGATADIELPPGVELVEERWVEAEDWMAAYRAASQPLAIGERLWVDPREPSAAETAVARAAASARQAASSIPPFASRFRGMERHCALTTAGVPAGRTLVRVPARSAFGTGSHASTRLVLRLLERLPRAGATVLDVGTGSGILAIAAVALGARRAAAFDVDLAAALLAGQHARLNGMSARICCWAGGIDALRPGTQFDVVVANALPHELQREQPRIAGAVRPGGDLLVSGIPADERKEVVASWLQRRELRPSAELIEEEWAACCLHRPLVDEDDDV